MTVKEIAANVVKQLPDNVSWHELNEELYTAAVREGLADLDAGKEVPHDRVKEEFASWFTK